MTRTRGMEIERKEHFHIEMTSLMQVKTCSTAPGKSADDFQTEANMAEQSSVHVYLDWAKERIDEMDAAVASLEVKANELKADSKLKADQMIAEMRKGREEFQSRIKEQSQAGEAAWARTRADLETQWNGFEGQMKSYFENVGKQIEQQQATFAQLAAAQAKAWQESADKLQEAAGKLAAAGRANVETAIRQMKSDAAEAEARLAKLQQAGNDSWAVLSAGLAESRKAFDQAVKTAWDAFKGAAAKS
jgi:hypothetical protein